MVAGGETKCPDKWGCEIPISEDPDKWGFTVIKVFSHPLISPLLCPKVSAKKIHYCERILGEADFIDLVSCTDWSMALKVIFVPRSCNSN